jgi:hypothetical protein
MKRKLAIVPSNFYASPHEEGTYRTQLVVVVDLEAVLCLDETWADSCIDHSQ